MFALLGDIQFDLITYFDGLSAKFGTTYAEHGLIEGKPRLQFIADNLDEFQIELAFHAHYCDPEKELLRLRDAIKSHRAMAFVLGNGDYKGWFVPVSLNATSEQTDELGGLIALTAQLELREFIGDKSKPVAVPSDFTKQIATHKANNAVATMKPTLSSMPQALSKVSAVRSAFQSAIIAFSYAQQLKSNPVAALAQAPMLATQLARISNPLLSLNDSVHGLPSAQQSQTLFNATTTALGSIRNAQLAISTANKDNVIGQIQSATMQLSTAHLQFENASPSFTQMAAKVVGRSRT